MIKEILQTPGFQQGVAVGVAVSFIGWLLNRITGIFSKLYKYIHTKFFKKPDPIKLAQARQKLKSEFEKNLRRRKRYDYGNAIIRDVGRLDTYPETNYVKNGISSWFRVEIKGLYHRGVELFIGMPIAIKYDGRNRKWELADYEEPNTIRAYPVGLIPFDNIVEVDWGGDEYYNFPHIYCNFKKNGPYEAIIYYMRRGEGENEYFEIVEGFQPNRNQSFFKKIKRLFFNHR
jgi:hypothetical protein